MSKKEEEPKTAPAPSKISIKNRMDELNQNTRATHKSEPFDRKQMLEAWSKYCESIKTSKINLYTIIVNSSIEKTEKGHIEISVDGPMKRAEIEAERNHIIQSMRKLLSNDEILLKVREVEKVATGEVTGLAQEKLSEAVGKFPEISVFIESLNLSPEL